MYNNFQPFNSKSSELAVKSLFAIILINILCLFILPPLNLRVTASQYIMGALDGSLDKRFLLFSLNHYGVTHLWLWQYVTSMFMHGDFSHILFNMYGLFLFGKLVAPILGVKRFLALYFFSGIFGGLVYTAVAALSGGQYFLIGASGAVMGITVACGMLLPNFQFMMLFFPTPIKAKTLVIIYIILNVLYQFAPFGDTNVAYVAHLGGALGAYIFLKIIYRKNAYMIWDPFVGLFGKKGLHKTMTKQYRAKDINRKNSNSVEPNAQDQNKYDRFSINDRKTKFSSSEKISQREIDYLLNKISEQGVKALTEEEFQKLKQIRKQVQKR
ncbi:rhomboid family intramembrane serine protease [Lentisphaerota bacterium WC36G]|nr:rhomboid family intramembrane serine protease [Lentisphaerae bacterium WC36]